jgi:hypothetical protein
MRLGLALSAIGLVLTLVGLVVVNSGSLGTGTADGSPVRLVFYFGPVLLAIGGVRVMAEVTRRSR